MVLRTRFFFSQNSSNKEVDLDGYKFCYAKENFYLASIGFSLEMFLKFKKLAAELDLIHYHFTHPIGGILKILT